ncbi:MAG: hypothetical protein GYB64_18675 [Chloroflexi bacterium]|nr:hypothetical protein [Chloroflexota bacterium]
MDDKTLIETLSRDMVRQVAPEELSMFDELMAEYHKDPSPPDLEAQPDDDALGFGLGEVLTAVTPAAGAISGLLVTFAIEVLKQSLADESADHLRDHIKRMLGILPRTPQTPRPDSESLRGLHHATMQEALRFGLTEDEARRLADAAVARFAIGA